MCEDITGGQEDIPIPATNLVDDPPVAPTGKLNSSFDTFMMGSLILLIFLRMLVCHVVSVLFFANGYEIRLALFN